MLEHEQLQQLSEKRIQVFGSDGEKIGSLGQVFLDEATRQPNFVSVHSGLFGSAEHIVPVEDAELADGHLNLRYTKHVVKGAPNIDPASPLGAAAERELYNYYAQPQEAEDQSHHHVSPGAAVTAAGLGTPLMADELIHQDNAVPEESRMRIIEVTEADPDLSTSSGPALPPQEEDPRPGNP